MVSFQNFKDALAERYRQRFPNRSIEIIENKCDRHRLALKIAEIAYMAGKKAPSTKS